MVVHWKERLQRNSQAKSHIPTVRDCTVQRHAGFENEHIHIHVVHGACSKTKGHAVCIKIFQKSKIRDHFQVIGYKITDSRRDNQRHALRTRVNDECCRSTKFHGAFSCLECCHGMARHEQ